MTPIEMPMRTESRDKVVCTEKFYRWAYAVFAGVVACPIALVFGSVRLSRLGEMSWGSLPWPASLILGAIICARFGAGHAARFGTESHGSTAAVFTWLFYSSALAFLIPLALIGVAAWNYGQSFTFNIESLIFAGIVAPVQIFLVSSFIVLPACAVGTLLFNGLLYTFAALRRSLVDSKTYR